MKKRLRKKRRFGEFQEFGFEVAFQLPSTLNGAQVFAFGDEFFDEVEAQGLLCGGACGHRWDVFVTKEGRGSATEEDREHLRRWLEGKSLVSDVRIGELVDAWHAA